MSISKISPLVLRSLICASVFSLVPVAVSAIGIGELSMLSKLGQPLFATVDTQLAKGEVIEDACLSLAAIEEDGASSSRVLFQTGLSARFNQITRKIEIRSKRSFNEPYASLRVQVQCKGVVSATSKIFAVLPEFESNPIPAVLVTPKANFAVAPEPKLITPKQIPPPNNLTKRDDTAIHAANPQPSAKPTGKMAESVSDAVTVKEYSQLRLQLTGGQLDMTRVGIASQADRESILAQKKLLDEDDPSAHFLAMQYKMKAMNEEIQSIRLKLANFEAGATSGTKAVKDKEQSVSDKTWHNILLLLLALITVVLAVFGMRHYRRIKARAPKPENIKTEPTSPPFKPVGESSITIVHPAGGRHLQASRDNAELQPIEPVEQDSQDKEEQTVLEEAELYAVYGHPDKAIRILQEFVGQFPKSENAWMLLLSIYSSCAQVTEFERAALQFLSHNKASLHWKTIQALGRTLDKDNSLYIEESPEKGALWLPSNTTKQRPIGDILIDLGYLSVQDMANCLGEFDPNQHGRFGNYLLTRRMINHAQLNEALLKQQSGDDAEVVSDERSDAQLEEELHDEFSTQIDDSTSDSPEQAAVQMTEHVQDKAFPIDFVIDDHTSKSASAEPAAQVVEDKSQPLSFHIDFDLITTSGKPEER